MQFGKSRMSCNSKRFQSSPGQKAGCNSECARERSHRWRVSILTRPEGRMQSSATSPMVMIIEVSILTRPEGRMQLGILHRQLVSAQNVSILTRPEGRMQSGRPRTCLGPRMGFNPHPARRPDAILMAEQIGALAKVSILTRPEGRMQCAFFVGTSRLGQCFNPHPARRPDAIAHDVWMYS